MLYHIIIFEYPSGKLIIEHTFKEIISEEFYGTLSDFLVALRIFSQGITKKGQKLDLVQFGDMIIKLDHLEEVSIDLALVFNSNNKNIINKMVPQIKKKILEYDSLFKNWNGVNKDQFSLLKEALLNTIRKVMYSDKI
ncbi:MAG: hypothetical protein ACFFAO_12895 [Candidatus Hermodarchaeota archaeon]